MRVMSLVDLVAGKNSKKLDAKVVAIFRTLREYTTTKKYVEVQQWKNYL